ncbi:peptidoglycan editing factor PgeF [Brevibacterium litoralis]|uniref:peptidoglycan editing factor PgeF n=1 Tax=Brevibacterium litoralis TaxID=3138935 RepID=UPI0032EE14E5
MLHDRLVVPGSRATVHMAVTDRRGGFSQAPYDSFDLARHVGDDDHAVEANRSLLATVVGLDPEQVSWVSQVHGDAVHVTGSGTLSGSVVEADAQITTEADLGLAILVADCTPVLLADPEAGVIGAVHAGRPGMAAGVVTRCVEAMVAAGARDLTAFVGPSVCPRCYEVPAAMRAEVAAVEPVSAAVSATGTPALDVAAGVVEQLSRAGVHVARWSRDCTVETPALFSHRRDGRDGGRTGRFAGLVWMTREGG